MAPPPPQPKRPPGLPPDGPARNPGLELPFNDEALSRRRPEPAAAAGEDPDDDGLTDPRYQLPPGVRNALFSQAYLAVEQGPNEGESISIPQGMLFVGRASTCDLRISHPSISRRHAQLTRSGERFFLRDLASQNGTYVNKVRVLKEVELFPGDEVVMGIAQLRLQAPSARTGIRPRPTAPPGRAPARGRSTRAVALAAATIGFALAAIGMFGWFKLSRGPSYEGLSAAEGVKAKPAPLPSQEPPVAPAPTPPPEPKRDAPPALAAVSKEPAPKPTAGGSKGTARRSSSARPAPDSSEEPAPAGASDATILARFEAGNLAAALELAKKKDARELHARLIRFKSHYESGLRALAAHNDGSALRHLDAALHLAEQLSGGWDTYSTDLRHQLSTLHLSAGTRLADNNPAGARKELSLALQYDPDNARAREQLTRLDPAASPDPVKPSDARTPATKRGAARSEIDAAFDH